MTTLVASPPIGADEEAGAAAAGVGAAYAEGAAGAAPPISLAIAEITSPTVRVRLSAATSLASTPRRDCTSERISTRLIESMPSSVSSSMSSSIMSTS